MSVRLVMPRLSDSMEDGELGRWLQPDGALVRQGDPVAEIETDKTTVELRAEGDGTLRHLYPPGTVMPVGECFGLIVGEDDPDGLPESDTFSRLENGRAEELNNQHSDGRRGTTPGPNSVPEHSRVRATPAARRAASELGVNLGALVPGSGPRGRIHRIDVERAASVEQTSGASGSSGPTRAQIDTVVTPSRIHEVTAQRTAQSKQTIPHFYISTVAYTASAEELRRSLSLQDRGEFRVTITDIILAACARALRVIPEVNSSWLDGQIIQRGSVNIGVAVALEDGGLMVPVVRDADTLRLSELARTTHLLTERARQGSLRPSDLDGASFTVSNLGMYGITEFHAIINPPESAILAVGAMQTNLVLREGELKEERFLTLSLSADHRAFSGATAARFMGVVKDAIENPIAMLV